MQDPTQRLFKLATEQENAVAREILDDSHKSIEYYYSLPEHEFDQLKPSLRAALINLKKLYESQANMEASFRQTLPKIGVDVFARRYYRWLRGENVPQHVLDVTGMSQEKYKQQLFAEWCNNVSRATVPVWITDESGNNIYLLPPLHCRDAITVKEQVGYTVDGPYGNTFVPSSGILNDNISKVDLLQTNDQREYAMKKLFDQSVSVNGASKTNVQQWLKAWDDAIEYFDRAFGLPPINAVEKPQAAESKVIAKDSGYQGRVSDFF